MKTAVALSMACFSFVINAGMIPATNGSYAGIGQGTSNHMGEGNDYETQITISDTAISSMTNYHEGGIVKLTYELIRTNEGFFNLSIKLRYDNGRDDVVELVGDGKGNCLYDACHFNGKIEIANDEAETLYISDIISFGDDGKISRRAVVDIYLVDDPRTISFVFNEKLTTSVQGFLL